MLPASGLALLAIWFAEKPASPERTYGYYRVEILAALTNAVVLIFISLYILYEAYERFKNPPEVQSGGMLGVASIGLVINIVGVFILRSGSKESLNMKGAYFEVLSDMLTSVGVIIAGIIMLTTGWYYADPLISAGIGLFILPRTWALLKDAVGVLLEGTPSDVNIANLRDKLVKDRRRCRDSRPSRLVADVGRKCPERSRRSCRRSRTRRRSATCSRLHARGI